MDARLQEFLDHHEIRKTLSAYCHGCDRGDAELMGSVYLEDSLDDHGPLKVPGWEFARVMTATILSDTKSLFHLLGQSIIRVEGDEAAAETYFLAVSIPSDDALPERCNQLGGRFVDQLRRENGEWKIKHRVAVRDWSISLSADADWGAQHLTRGARGAADPSVAAFQTIRS